MNNKINDTRFLNNINTLTEDMKRAGSANFVNELENITKDKCITPLNTQTLIPFLQYRKDTPSHYIKEIQHGLSVGLNFKELLIDTNQLEKDHLYMYNILLEYLEWDETDFGMFVISKKVEEVA